MQIGEVIKSRRLKKKLTQDSLAALLGIKDNQTISRWEKNEIVPGGRYLIELMKILKLQRKDFEQIEEKATEPVLEEVKK
jgi:transcriptional regulator with XRE-family HTH domain